MMPKKYSLVIGTGFLILGFLCQPWPCFGISGRGTTAATFLKIGVGPRAVAMGESFVAVADDASALYWNPAGLAQLQQPEMMAMHVFWLEDIYFDHIAGVLPLPVGVAGASLIYLNSGTLFRSEANDTPSDPDRGSFSASNIAFTGGYSYTLDKKMYLGSTIVLFSETIDSQASLGWALDVGFLYHLPWEGFSLGAVVQNLGPANSIQEEYFRMPINFKLGFGYAPQADLLLTLDYNQLLEQGGKIGLGAEYIYEKTVSVRAGYSYQERIDNSELYSGFGTNALSGLTAGMGVHYMNFRLDYAFVPYGFLGSTHRIALTYSPEKPAPQATPVITPTSVPTVIPAPEPQPEVQQQALEAKIQEIERKIQTGQLASIQFGTGDALLTGAAKQTLDEVAAELIKFPELHIRIEGHTDAQGSAAANLRLSQKRTEAVKQYLAEQHGLNPENLTPIGFGAKRPIASNSTKKGRSQNRRVEFKVLETDKK